MLNNGKVLIDLLLANAMLDGMSTKPKHLVNNRKTRLRIPGKRNPAGTKFARDAESGTCTLRCRVR